MQHSLRLKEACRDKLQIRLVVSEPAKDEDISPFFTTQSFLQNSLLVIDGYYLYSMRK